MSEHFHSLPDCLCVTVSFTRSLRNRDQLFWLWSLLEVLCSDHFFSASLWMFYSAPQGKEKATRRNTGTQVRKEDTRGSLLGGMVVYVENPRGCTKRLLEPTVRPSKDTGCKVSIQKSFVFYTYQQWILGHLKTHYHLLGHPNHDAFGHKSNKFCTPCLCWKQQKMTHKIEDGLNKQGLEGLMSFFPSGSTGTVHLSGHLVESTKLILKLMWKGHESIEEPQSLKRTKLEDSS